MERKTLARWLVVSALACFGFFLFSGIAGAQENTVQGTQNSQDAQADTGNVEGGNDADFNVGPQSDADRDASANQLGSNSATVSQSGTAESGDPVAGGQITGVIGDDVTVQNTNNADTPDADSGDADIDNDVDLQVGPFINGNVAERNASASQVGDNEVDVAQAATASTGDAVAGGQVTGIVGDGEHTVQNTNIAEDGDADSGDVDIDNDAELEVGPFAESDDRDATANQIGDNDAVLSQAAEGVSGDALAHAQVTGIVGGSATVQQTNTSDTGDADSGDVDIDNDVDDDSFVGPTAEADTARNATAQQTGDNSLDVSQSIEGETGDALAGAQVVGAVGDAGGFLTVQNQQASEDDDADSGDLDFIQNNIEDVPVGPTADSDDRDATAVQNGDNDVIIDQSMELETGDALAGAQVTGAVGHEEVTIQNNNFAEDPQATSGDVVDADNIIDDVDAGPDADGDDEVTASQIGDNSVVTGQTIEAESGDAVAGAQVTGAVLEGSEATIQNTNTADGADADSGDVDAVNVLTEIDLGPDALGGDPRNATANQIGDNELVFAQDGVVASGDAVAGSQVTGLVGADESTVQVTNNEQDSDADSGDAEHDNIADGFVGPQAEADRNATTQQNGDSTVDGTQGVDTESGDAVAGGQVTGEVGPSGEPAGAGIGTFGAATA